jgi:hypothetical protein
MRTWLTLPNFVGIFVHVSNVVDIGPELQSRILRLSRRANLLGVLVERVETAGVLMKCPAALRDQLNGGKNVALDFERMLCLEVRELERFLRPLAVPLVLLKGAAYAALGLSIARGRLASDVDILVPEARIAEVERTLLNNGWVTQKTSDYDQRYYREWMHELPPLRHRTRLTVVDVHHNILPRTSRFAPSAASLLERIVPVEGRDLYTLAPEDMVLHNCVHLFIDGDLDNRVRELVDLDGLLRTYCDRDQAFLDRLIARADELGLQLALFFGLYFASEFPDTPVTPAALETVTRSVGKGPARRLVLSAMRRALLPELMEERTLLRKLSTDLLYLRSHWLRMPARLLIPHLWHQARSRGGLKSAESVGVGG